MRNSHFLPSCLYPHCAGTSLSPHIPWTYCAEHPVSKLIHVKNNQFSSTFVFAAQSNNLYCGPMPRGSEEQKDFGHKKPGHARFGCEVDLNFIPPILAPKLQSWSSQDGWHDSVRLLYEKSHRNSQEKRY